MKTVRICAVASVVCCSLLFGLTVARPAAAQCLPDPPTGSSSTPNCGNEERDRGTAPAGPIIARVPLYVFVRNPIVSMAAWIVTRPQSASSAHVAVKPNGYTEKSFRVTRGPRSFSW